VSSQAEFLGDLRDDRSPAAAFRIHARAPEVRRVSFVSPRAARRDGARSAVPDRDRSHGRSTRDSRTSSKGSPDIVCSPHALRAGTARGPQSRTATGPTAAALGIHAPAPKVRRTSFAPPRAARRDGARSAVPDRDRSHGRSTRNSRTSSKGSPDIVCSPHALRAGTARGPQSPGRDQSPVAALGILQQFTPPDTASPCFPVR